MPSTQSTNTTSAKRVICLTLAGICATTCLTPGAQAQLPEGVRLPDGVELPDNFELPAGIEIPPGFEITEEMVRQYLKYMESQDSGSGGQTTNTPLTGDEWFKQLAQDHPTSDIQMNMQRVDETSAEEESAFKDKFMDAFMSKEIILPLIIAVIAIIAVWAFMTKCGRRSCCKREVQGRVEANGVRKSVRSDRSETCTVPPPDIENHSHITALDMDGLSKGSVKGSQMSKVVKPNLEMSHQVRISEPSGQNSIFPAIDQRQSVLSAPVNVNSVGGAQRSYRSSNPNNTANRKSLPTVKVPIDQIKAHSRRSQGPSDQVSISRPSMVSN